MAIKFREGLLRSVSQCLAQDYPEHYVTTAGSIKSLDVPVGRYVYALTVETGRTPEIPEYAIRFYRFNKDDEYRTTSPSALSKSLDIPFDIQKRIALSDGRTALIKEKRSYIHWLLSPTKEWFFIAGSQQAALAINELASLACRKFIRFITDNQKRH